MTSLGYESARSGIAHSVEDALRIKEEIPLPLIIRPSFTLGGMGGSIAESEEEYIFPNVDLTENYLGRMDAPWALFDGACPEVMSLTCGFNSGPKGSKNFVLAPGERRIIYVANAFQCYANPRIGMGFYSAEFTEDGVVFKRTKSWAMIPIDHRFQAIREQSARIFNPEEE